MESDLEAAQLFQLELEGRRYREDELISRLRKDCSNFRKVNDEFDAEFKQALKLLQEYAYDEYQRFELREPGPQ